MKIKLMERGVAEVVLSRWELSACGVSAESLSPKSRQGQQLLYAVFDALEQVCGLRRGGHFTFVECRPYHGGGCRLSVGYTEQPSGRLYAFDCADDMLDAISHMRYNEYFNTKSMNIHRSGDQFLLFLPPSPDLPSTHAIDRHNLAILSEYGGPT